MFLTRWFRARPRKTARRKSPRRWEVLATVTLRREPQPLALQPTLQGSFI
jgi:hypothetical protein